MSRSVNKVILLGHLGKDAETKFTPSGAAVTNFSVATSRRWKDGNEWKETTDWHNIVAWRMEKLADYLTKGTQVYVEGRLSTRSYEDKHGVKKYVTEVVADEVVLCGGEKSRSQPASQQASRPASAPASNSTPYDDLGNELNDDDVPF